MSKAQLPWAILVAARQNLATKLTGVRSAQHKDIAERNFADIRTAGVVRISLATFAARRSEA